MSEKTTKALTTQTPADKKALENYEKFINSIPDYSDTIGDTLNAFIYGDSGTGKTYSLQTLPRPLLVFSFDPTGSRRLANIPGITVINCENDSRKKAKMFDHFEKTFSQLWASGALNHIKSIAIDSLTNMDRALENKIAVKLGKIEKPLTISDYNLKATILISTIEWFLSAPCNCILIGHGFLETGESGEMKGGILLGEKTAKRIINKFDELYLAFVKKSSSGPKYLWRIRPEGIFHARTRILSNDSNTDIPQDFNTIFEALKNG